MDPKDEAEVVSLMTERAFENMTHVAIEGYADVLGLPITIRRYSEVTALPDARGLAVEIGAKTFFLTIVERS